jgi:hypothetical protein
MFDLQLLASGVPGLYFSFQDWQAAPLVAPSAKIFNANGKDPSCTPSCTFSFGIHTIGKQLDPPKLKVQQLNGKMP